MCNHLFAVKNVKTGGFEMVPCGHCISCLAEMQSDWATRLSIEYKSNLQRPAIFITLTYNDDNLPTEEYNKEGVMYENPSVVKGHCQQFFRNLRTLIERKKKKHEWRQYGGALKYFLTSEYGPEHGRPHYHAIIFGLRNCKETHDIIEQCWTKGFVHVQDITEGRIVYTTKYCTKPVEFQKNRERIGYFDEERWLDDMGIRRKCFRLMSKNLGESYCKDKANLKFHFNNIIKNNYIRVNGYKKKMPRYYKKKIYTDANGEQFCKNYSQSLAKITRYIHKKDKEYGINYNFYGIDNAIGRCQYYRHLADTITKQQIDEGYVARSDKDAEQRENSLISRYREWFKRPNRYHPQ